MPRASVYRRISTANTNAAVIKATPGRVHGGLLFNVNAAARYLKLYNKATAPDENDTPVLTILIPGNTAGAGVAFDLSEIDVPFSAGIAMRLVTGMADNNTGAVAASEQVVNLFYV